MKGAEDQEDEADRVRNYLKKRIVVNLVLLENVGVVGAHAYCNRKSVSVG